MNFEPVIGLEVHAQLLTVSKIFCGCSTEFGMEPNRNTCPVCLALPGALPVLNAEAVHLALRAALALNCEVPEESIFARKNYFYPDLPKGYQISQFDHPLAIHGKLEATSNGQSREIRIRRIHMEEDAGKLLHEGVEPDGRSSYVDLNRAGVPLIEIVTEPDLKTPEEAYSYLTALKAILRYAGVSTANMEEGKLRCDANISLRPAGRTELGTKVEIKNLNSFKNVQRALEYEIERQTRALESGESIVQETRLFDADKGLTESMRSKEEAHDYRYFPDPDLLPLRITADQLRSTRESLPELPAQKKARFSSQYGLSSNDAQTLTEEIDLANFYEETVKASQEPKLSANWILRDLLKNLKDSGLSLESSPVKPAHIAELVKAISASRISSNQGKEVFEIMWNSGDLPVKIMKDRGMEQISDEDQIARWIDEALSAQPEIVTRYRAGETKLLGVLVGQIMKSSRGKANPAAVSKMLQTKLEQS